MAQVEGVATTRASGGEIPAFEAVYREHFGFVYACLLRLGVPDAAVDDAAQDVFVTVHRRLPAFEGRSALRSWLFGIVRRIAFRHRRSALRLATRRRALADEHDPGAPGADLAASVEQAQRSALLLQALDTLDDDKRTALTLHVFEDLRGPEVAEFLGINVDTAYSRIKAARRELTRALTELGLVDDEATLVTATKRATTADATASRRVAALLAVRLGPGAGAGVTGALAGVGTKGIFAALALGASLSVGLALRDPSPDVPPAATTGVASSRDASRPAPAELDGARPIPAELTPVSVDAAATTRREPSTPPADGRGRAAAIDGPLDRDPVDDAPVDALAAALAAEVELITAAKTALDAGDPDAALARLADHARRFPIGQLANERRGYRAIALCEAGKPAAGRGEARVFLDAHPGSPLATRVRRACEVSSESP